MTSEAQEKISMLEHEIDRLEKKLKAACELNLKLFEDYQIASRHLKALEDAMHL